MPSRRHSITSIAAAARSRPRLSNILWPPAEAHARKRPRYADYLCRHEMIGADEQDFKEAPMIAREPILPAISLGTARRMPIVIWFHMMRKRV